MKQLPNFAALSRGRSVGLLFNGGPNRRLLVDFLHHQGCHCYLATSVQDLQGRPLQAVLVDDAHAAAYPDQIAGFKADSLMIPVLLFLSPRSTLDDNWLCQGVVDDVIRMPIAKPELAARLRLALRLSEQARVSNLKLSRLLQDARWGIAVLEPENLAIEVANPAFARMHGYRAEEMRGLPFASLQCIPQDLWRVSMSGMVEIWHRRRDGSTFPIEMEVTHYCDESGGEYYAAFVRDIQARTQREAELLSQYREVQQARALAEQASRAKSQFLANISHEIRTPLNGVIATLSMLVNTPLSERQKELAELIGRSSEVLLSMVNEILDFAKIEAGQMELEHVVLSLPELVEDVARSFELQARAKNVELTWEFHGECPEAVQADPLRLRQIFQNLLSNAVKFTERGHVKFRVYAGDRDWVCFEVSDTGVGISPELQQSIFEPFTQADSSTTRRFGGTGLGLSICDRLVRLFQGRLEIESQLGEGSCFRCWLPLKAAQQACPARGRAPEPAPPAGPALRVLLCEDNPLNQRIMTLLLQQLGHEVVVAQDGPEGFKTWEEGSFDLILMDLQMPGLGGMDVTRQIRQKEVLRGGSRIPIIALTARTLDGDREDCLAAGMDDFLTKPLQIDHLAEVLRGWGPCARRGGL